MVVVGRQNGDDRQTIVHVSVRKDGAHWDCMEPGIGVVTSEETTENSMRVLVIDSGEERVVNWSSEKSLRIGEGVHLGLSHDPKYKKVEVFVHKRRELTESDIKRVQGQLRRNPAGFGFVENAFVPSHIVESIDSSIDEVIAVTIYAKNPAKGEYGWRVIELNAV
jgi:hypothetical protein